MMSAIRYFEGSSQPRWSVGGSSHSIRSSRAQCAPSLLRVVYTATASYTPVTSSCTSLPGYERRVRRSAAANAAGLSGRRTKVSRVNRACHSVASAAGSGRWAATA
ncbi:hypothetical protein SMD44_08519 [Streptomyces alboflavus]|uniref:Uncharacterized protein n=1 Tax=Streptomyces alboflavus TaxID=67267 RepID=A0A1Z1WRT4_9ACTN|nr:hypothetical protein SMD44_08519 [Streptomyces alboflavus]